MIEKNNDGSTLADLEKSLKNLGYKVQELSSLELQEVHSLVKSGVALPSAAQETLGPPKNGK